MTVSRTVTLAATLAFAAGVAVGVLCGRDCLNRVRNGRQSPSDAFETNASTATLATRTEGDSHTQPEAVRVPPETTVEVTYADSSSEPTSEILAAHRARQAKRAAVREAKAEKRRDFLSNLNLDLLSADQRKLHAEYTEAVMARDAARREIRDLRAKGEEVSDDLSRRLADAESVIRADAAEEHRVLRAAAARVHGMDDAGVDALLEDLAFIDSVMGLGQP